MKAQLIERRAGISSGFARSGGVVKTSVATLANVSTVETDLASYTVPANALNADGDHVYLVAWGTTNNTANTKTIRVYFGSTLIHQFSITSSSTQTWRLEARVLKDGTNSVRYVVWSQNGQTGASQESGSASPTLSSSQVFKVTGQSSATSFDVSNVGAVFEWKPGV